MHAHMDLSCLVFVCFLNFSLDVFMSTEKMVAILGPILSLLFILGFDYTYVRPFLCVPVSDSVFNT